VAPEQGLIYGFATTPPPAIPICRTVASCAPSMSIQKRGGRGIGRALVSAARARLLGTGVWVPAGNVRAERFYRIDRWAPDGVRRTDSTRGMAVEELWYQREL
jgi:hypothetical protein